MSHRTRPLAEDAPQQSRPARLQVVPTPEGWQLRNEGAEDQGHAYSTQAEAIEAAQSRLQADGGALRVQDRNGRWRESFTLGLSAMMKLAAVEGITFTPEMKRKLKAARAGFLSDAERLAILGVGKARR
ncbi:MAG: DUF2188 domain-containing protein [Caulobacter sp.]|nr:DUF2188 domain-containing protein [Caulobacter sp.]